MSNLLSYSTALANELQQSLSYSKRAQLTFGTAAIVGVYLQLFVSRYKQPGYSRLPLVAPIVALNFWLPLLFNQRSEVVSRAASLLLNMWLGSFKAIGLCLGRGPLYGQWTVAQTVLLYMMPIYPSTDTGGVRKGRLTDTHGTTGQAVLSFVANTTVLTVLAYALATYNMPTTLKYYVYAFALYGFITFIMDGPAALLISLMDLQVVPPFDKPWMSETITDFWSRRWNNTVSLTLRALVYDPIVEGTLVSPQRSPAAQQQQQQQQQQPSQRSPIWLRLLGMCSTFAVSGIYHEIILYYVTPAGQYRFGWWFAFFLVQAPLIVLETVVHRRLRAAKVHVPRLVGIACTTFVLMVCAMALWYPPLDKHTSLAVDITHAVNNNIADCVTYMQQLGQRWGFTPALAAAINPSSAV